VADQRNVAKLEVVDQRGDIAAIVLDRAFLRPAGRLPVAAKIARNDFVVGFEFLDLKPPVIMAAGKAVHEEQCWGADASAYEMHTDLGGRCASPMVPRRLLSSHYR